MRGKQKHQTRGGLHQDTYHEHRLLVFVNKFKSRIIRFIEKTANKTQTCKIHEYMTEQGRNLHVKPSLRTWSHCLTLNHPNPNVIDSIPMKWYHG